MALLPPRIQAALEVGRCTLMPVHPLVEVPGFSSSNLNTRRLHSSFALYFNLHRPTEAGIYT